jgi:hypothetical protein
MNRTPAGVIALLSCGIIATLPDVGKKNRTEFMRSQVQTSAIGKESCR